MIISDLIPVYDTCKSFYGKAKVVSVGVDCFDLISYETTVSTARHGKVEHLGKWSQTTTRHQKEFEKQYSHN